MSIVQPIARPIMESIARPITAPSTGSVWSPARLFTASEPGIAYDLTDKTKLYQDSTRTTLVAANGDPIGSVTDLSGNGKHASQATTASKPLFQGYADFDGVDDSWATAAIDFSTTDKITVVCGMQLDADVTGMLIELSAIANSNAGSFYITAREAAGGVFGFRLSSTTFGGYNSSSRGAPFTAVLTSQMNIGAAGIATEIIPRINGVVDQTSISGGGGGTGNFGSYPLYIGRRAGTAVPFDGRIYRMIVIGRTLTAAELARAERWCAAPAGVVLP